MHGWVGGWVGEREGKALTEFGGVGRDPVGGLENGGGFFFPGHGDTVVWGGWVSGWLNVGGWVGG